MAERFSKRTSWDGNENSLARAIREARESGRCLVDLTISNPTLCGFEFDAERILGALGNPAAMRYEANSQGILRARAAVKKYYSSKNTHVNLEDIVLTTSTSEAYSFLFCLLCNAGDSILVMQPSYPLFDFLADLDDVQLETFPLFEDFGWWIDFAELERKISERTKAIVVVHPNNPTGHATSAAERVRLEELCLRQGLALIVDEVFLDYGLRGSVESFATGEHACLKFVVSGISKIAALPQMKVGWIVCCGPEAERREAMARLEVVADTFLSLNLPAQLALPVWLEGRAAIQGQILERVRANLHAVAAAGIDKFEVEAGWSAILRLPSWVGSDVLAEQLVDEVGLIVHPGSFYGLPGRNVVVVSLIGPAEEFAKGAIKLKAWCESRKLTG